MLNEECVDILLKQLGVDVIRAVPYCGDIIDKIVFNDEKYIEYNGILIKTSPSQRLQNVKIILRGFGYSCPNISAHMFIMEKILDKNTKKVVAYITRKCFEECDI